MGEALKRKRVESFEHQWHAPYQRLVNADLLSAARRTVPRRELTCRLTNTETDLVEGSVCLVRPAGEGYEVIHGNSVVARLPVEAKEEIARYERAVEALHRLLPCRVTRVGALGSVSLAVDIPEESDE